MSDLKPVDSKIVTEPVEYFSGRDRMRFEQFRRDVRPLIDPSKPMLYVASGYDAACFLGSGARSAEFVDPVYERRAKEGRGITPLIDWIAHIDPAVTADMSFQPGASVRAKIRFEFEQNKKTINLIGEDAREYKPENTLHSVFASIGHGTPELFLPSCKAQVYVTSLICPRAWGYQNIVRPTIGETDIQIATGYKSLNLSVEDTKILTDLNTSEIEWFVEGLQKGRVNNSLLYYADVDSQAHNPNDLLLLYFEKKFSVLSSLNPVSRQAFIEDMTSYINVLFDRTTNVPRTGSVKSDLIESVQKHL